MSEAPERIWAQCSAHQNWDDLNASRYKIDWWQEYRRADLPPTLSAAMELPEVQALVNALRDMRRQFSPYPSEDTERWREEHEACERADAALAAIKEPKP